MLNKHIACGKNSFLSVINNLWPPEQYKFVVAQKFSFPGIIIDVNYTSLNAGCAIFPAHGKFIYIRHNAIP